MFYIIETSYAGPNPGEHLNHDTFDISSVPAQTNMSHEVRTSGWCGTTGDWAVYAHGAYETVEAARATIHTLLAKKGWRTPTDTDDNIGDEDHLVERYLVGKLPRWTADSSVDFVWDGIREEINELTTDTDIDLLAKQWADEARVEVQAELDKEAIRRAARQHRDVLADESDD